MLRCFMFWMAFLLSSVPLYAQSYRSYYDHPEKNLPSPSFSEVEKILRSGKVRTIPELLSWYQGAYPDVLSRFTLMRESESLQGASPENPRVIVYGPRAELIFTFNGHSNQKGYDVVEWIEFDKQQSKFRFFETGFDREGQRFAEVSEANPAKCMQCHGVSLRPIWEQYDFWPGAYGEDDDALIQFEGVKYPPFISDPDRRARHTLHRQQFLSFRDSAKTHERYRFLKFFESKDSDVAPYIPRPRMGTSPLRPNLNLTALLAPMQGQQLAERMAKDTACFNSAAAVFAALALNCDLLEYVTDPVKEARNFVRESLPEDPIRWSTSNEFEANSDLARIMGLFGMDHTDWHMGRQPKQWRYFIGFRFQYDDVVAALFERFPVSWMLPKYNSVRAILYPGYYEDDDYSADEQQGTYNGEPHMSDMEYGERQNARSAPERAWGRACKALVDQFPPDLNDITRGCDGSSVDLDNEAENKDLTVVSMCQSCHQNSGTESALAPPLFDETGKALSAEHFKEIFRRIELPVEDPEHMPPQRKLSLSERVQLREMLQ
jgi:hypothetical protein